MVTIVSLRSERAPEKGPRLGPVNTPREDYYDVWLPVLAPSAPLLESARETDEEWADWCEKYRQEMSAPEPSRILDLLALMSQQANFSVGCYCESETRCHRSVLRELLLKHGAEVKAQA
jgi:uncharacterized protein YeaO (DUF488 family)